MKTIKIAKLNERQLEVKRGFKELAKKYKMGFKQRSINAKSEWMQIFRPTGVDEFPVDLRQTIVKTIFPKGNILKPEDPVYGNIEKKMISLMAPEWLRVMDALGIKVNLDL